MNSRKLARHIEVAFFPLVPIFFALLFILIYTQNMFTENITVLSILSAVFLVSHFTVRRKVKEENKKYTISSAIVAALFFILSYLVGVSRELFFVAVTLLIIAIFTYSIRPNWKISAHMITFISMATIVSFFNIYLVSLFILTPFVGWCRLKLKRHTLNQVIVGTLLGFIVPFIIFYFFF